MVRVSVVVEGVEGGGVLAAAELGAGAGQLAAHPAVAQLAVILALLPLGHNHSDSVSESGEKSLRLLWILWKLLLYNEILLKQPFLIKSEWLS